jgi:hypothetical protein
LGLILLFINDLLFHIQNANLAIYADDATLSLIKKWKNSTSLTALLQDDIENVSCIRGKEILKEKGVSTHMDLPPENDDLPLQTPITNQLQEYKEGQEEKAEEPRKETAENVFQNSWLQETETNLHHYVMQFQSETNPVTRSGFKGMIEILREKLRAHHSTLGTLRMKRHWPIGGVSVQFLAC